MYLYFIHYMTSHVILSEFDKSISTFDEQFTSYIDLCNSRHHLGSRSISNLYWNNKYSWQIEVRSRQDYQLQLPIAILVAFHKNDMNIMTYVPLILLTILLCCQLASRQKPVYRTVPSWHSLSGFCNACKVTKSHIL